MKKVLVKRLNTRVHIPKVYNDPVEECNAYQLSCSIITMILESPWHSIVYILECTLPLILLDSNKTAKTLLEEGHSKRQISVKLDANRMEKIILLYNFEYPKNSSICN